MRSTLTLPWLVLFPFGLCAQQITYSEDFENGQLDSAWFWTGNAPVLVAGCNSTYSISKESADLCVPPLAQPWTLSLLFHPVEFDATAQYTLSASIRVDGPQNGSTVGEIGLGWLVTSGGFSFYYGNAHSVSNTCENVQLSPPFIGPGFPGAQFGIALHLAPSASLAHALFDNIKLSTNKSSGNGILEPSTDLLSIGPNPTLDHLDLLLAPSFHPLSMELMDARGAVVRSLTGPLGEHLHFEVADLPSGMYSLRIMQKNSSSVYRIVKE